MLSAFGLSGAAGLNAYVPLFLVGLLYHFDKIQLAQPFDLLGEPWALGLVAVLGLLDLVGDKIAGLDHILHLVGAVVSTAAGALLFASQSGVAEVPPSVSMALGFLVSGGVHATRSAVRPLATASSAGIANPIVSTVEDISSATLSLLAIFAPILVVVVFGVLIMVAINFFRKRQSTKLRV